jgi:hypothetical protein
MVKMLQTAVQKFGMNHLKHPFDSFRGITSLGAVLCIVDYSFFIALQLQHRSLLSRLFLHGNFILDSV